MSHFIFGSVRLWVKNLESSCGSTAINTERFELVLDF